MVRDPEKTRTAIMDSAEALILDHGFAGTSVESVVEAAGVTKGAFFHHFDTKADLARALVERYARWDREKLEGALERAERMSNDPLQQVLIVLTLFQEDAESLTEPYPGCLFASFGYQTELFDDETMDVARRAMLHWRERLAEKLDEAVERHPPRLEVEVDSLADMATVAFEGAFIVSKTLKDPKTLAQQIGHYKRYLELLFGVEA